MIKKYLKQAIECHEGTVNRIIHVVGFAFIGIGIFKKSLLLVIIGGLMAESGHFYQYAKTKDPKSSPLFCFKPQLIFAYPIYILIVLYVILAQQK